METPSAPGPSPAGPASPAALDALLDVPMPVVIEIGRSRLTVQEILALEPGSVIELDRAVGDPVDLYVSDRRLAQGEIVVVGEQFGLRITRVLGEGDLEATS
jgi:flagellar motor switch protein FliN/FliY